MPDRRKHRGAAPGDQRLFAAVQVPALRSAVHDLSWLLSRGYADRSSLKIVGDRYALTVRQRSAVMRAACADVALETRWGRELPPEEVRGRNLLIDGYNVLTSVEAALAGGALFIGRDGCLRDVASMHGSFRKVEETEPAIQLIASHVRETLKPARATWYLDQPVSNSGRLRTLLAQVAESHGMDWSIELVPDPDRVLIGSDADAIVCSADSVILDEPNVRWFNLARHLIESQIATAWIIDLCS